MKIGFPFLAIVVCLCCACDEQQPTTYAKNYLTQKDNMTRQTLAARTIAQQAFLMQQSLYGDKANAYSLLDQAMFPAIRYWAFSLCGVSDQKAQFTEIAKAISSCSGVKPGLVICNAVCNVSTDGDLHAVEFALGVFGSLGNDFALPATGSASRFLENYQHENGWIAITPITIQQAHGTYTAENIPWIGDIVGFQSDTNPSGHLAIVVEVSLPQTGKDGYVIVAGANQSGNLSAADLQARGAQRGNFEKIIWHSPAYMDEHKDAEMFMADNWQKDPEKPDVHLQGFMRRLSYYFPDAMPSSKTSA